ncbi:MAG: hypothetical protein ACOYMN_09195, partial [Roseimicrobium sp.]
MNWHDFLNIARVRAVEDADAEGQVWHLEARRAVTRDAGADAAKDVVGFLCQRARKLTMLKQESVALSRMHLPEVPVWAAFGLWCAAFVVGWWLSALGQEREINLLAL